MDSKTVGQGCISINLAAPWAVGCRWPRINVSRRSQWNEKTTSDNRTKTNGYNFGAEINSKPTRDVASEQVRELSYDHPRWKMQNLIILSTNSNCRTVHSIQIIYVDTQLIYNPNSFLFVRSISRRSIKHYNFHSVRRKFAPSPASFKCITKMFFFCFLIRFKTEIRLGSDEPFVGYNNQRV